MNLRHPIVALMLLLASLWVPSSLSSPAQSSAADTDTPHTADYNLHDVSLHSFLSGFAGCIEVVIDPSAEEFLDAPKVSLRLNQATPMRALKEVIESLHLKYEYSDYKTLIIFRGAIPKSVKSYGITYRNTPLSPVLAQFAQVQGFKIVLLHPDQYVNVNVNIELKGISYMRGFEEILKSYGLTYQRRDCGTIVVFRDESSTGK